ncbi:hypothetical protein C8R44DRAFT_808936 [Mycena epipterygia]|nr:hypothetical protein C8R44DRAFT_808936 [Mycena epipterygia]
MFSLRALSTRVSFSLSLSSVRAPRSVAALRSLSSTASRSAAFAACFNCGEPDHQVAACPKPPTCHRCGEEGHLSKWCTNSDTGRARPKACYNCRGTDHLSKECTESRDRKAARPQDNSRKQGPPRPSGGFGLR